VSPELTPRRLEGEPVFCGRCRSVLRDEHGLSTGWCESCCARESCPSCEAKAGNGCDAETFTCCDEEGCDLAADEGCCDAIRE